MSRTALNPARAPASSTLAISVPFRSVPFRSVPFRSVPFRSVPFRSVPTGLLLLLLVLLTALCFGCNDSTQNQLAPSAPSADGCGECAAGQACVSGACVCSPTCGGKAGQSDGCGGVCGCAPGLVSAGDGACVAPADCTDTCVARGWLCGDLCGSPCGTCPEGQACTDGTCLCAPSCDGTRCEDGCGGSCPCADGRVCDGTGTCVVPADCKASCSTERAACGSVCGEFCGPCGDTLSCKAGACVSAESCPDCSLVLRLTARVVLGSLIERVTVSVDYQPPEGEPNPRLLDVRLGLPPRAELLRVERGPALVLAGKNLELDAGTGQPWRRRSDGSVQLLALALGNTTEISTGRLLTFELELDHPGPVELRLLRHPQTFAPESADGALQATAYDTPLTVTR